MEVSLQNPDELEALEQLWEAVHDGDRASIEALLVGDEEHPPLGCSVDVQDANGMSPLHWLATEGHSEVAEWIIDEVGAEVELGDARFGQTALHFAAVKNNARVAEQLLARKANPLVRCKSGWTPLHAAACSGSVDTAAVLLAAISKGDVDVRGPNNQTPLHRASFWGQVGTVRMLLSAGADRTLADAGGSMPLHLVCDGGHQRREIPKLQKMLKSPPPALR